MGNRSRFLTAALLGAVACLPLGAAAAGSLDPETNTDGFNPAASAYQIGEARRQALIGRQLELNYRLSWSAGYPACGAVLFAPALRARVEQPIGHESRQAGPTTWTYRPIFPGDVEELPQPAADAPRAGVPEVKGPRLPGPSEPEPPAVPPVGQTKKKPAVGPREF